jgi:hypothetical protein
MRAWTGTLAIYRRGLKENLWSRVASLEDVLAARRAGEPLADFVFRYLDSRFRDPSEGPFARPPVRAALRALRQELSEGRLPRELGEIGELTPEFTE